MHRNLVILALLVALAACGAKPEKAEPAPAQPALTAAEQHAIELVNLAADSLQKDAAGAIAAINSGSHPFSGTQNEYTFLYDTTATMVAHPNPALVGVNLADKPDAYGKMFRKQIVEQATQDGDGWTTYTYTKPNEDELEEKKTYGKLVIGSDSKPYVVCSGVYSPEE